ncbi:uncharacterized protein LOC114360797 [Ostrinia furnacalis]|uniref:uncharacterized protein LOC114360797 n=1 Tax=Ostrinia furnacalis TaxID=93504 RepID=UPI00103F8735|nr:uncharacterized protein LOC114360797 [Ostrinia furnacalis]
MKVVSVVLLSILALANAGPTLQNIHFADSFQQSLSPQEYHVKLAAPDTELSVEDHVVEYFNSLDRQERSFIGDVIKNALEGFRDVVINGNDDVPVLDPFVIDHMGPFLFTATGVRGEANIRNFRVEGLRWFLVDHVTFNALRLTLGLQVTVPWITTTGKST